MKVLMLSIDSSILKENSKSWSRMRDYGSICDELHIIVLGAQGKNAKITENVFVYKTSKKRIHALIHALMLALKILNKNFIITSQDPFEAGFIGWLLAKKFKIGLEIQLHGDFYSNPYWKKERLLNFFRYYLGEFVLRRANVVRVMCKRVKDSIVPFVDANTKIFQNPIYLGELKESQAEKNENKLVILAVGNLVPVKNHEQLIEVFAEVKHEISNVALIIVGEGFLRKNLQLVANSLQLEEDVEFTGHRTDLENLYTNSDVFVHPSFYEGWGRSPIEAASFGVPIIMSDVGLAGEVIKNEESGLIVPVNDKNALKQAIIRLVKNRELRERLGKGAKVSVLGLLNKNAYLVKIKESWEAAYKSKKLK